MHKADHVFLAIFPKKKKWLFSELKKEGKIKNKKSQKLLYSELNLEISFLYYNT
jgi:hypothetical protein